MENHRIDSGFSYFLVHFFGIVIKIPVEIILCDIIPSRQLPVEYNVTPYYFNRNLDNYPKEMHEEIRDARIDPVVFHYAGPVKPWSLGCYVPGKKLFRKYQKESGWRHCTIQKHVLKKIVYTLFTIIKKKGWEDKTYIEGWNSFYSI